MREFLMSDIDVQEFMRALDNCRGNVYLINDEGDKFNLKLSLIHISEPTRRPG